MNLNGREVDKGALPGEADAFGGLKVGSPKKSKSANLKSLACFSFNLHPLHEVSLFSSSPLCHGVACRPHQRPDRWSYRALNF